MKRLALAFLALFTASALFAQNDLQVLAVVKLNKNESITVKQLKTRVEAYQKQSKAALSLENKKLVLDAMIQEKLVTQAAAKANITVTDSEADQYFLSNVSQTIGKNVTEQEFEALVKQQTNMSLDDYMKQTTGMSVSDYKNYLKNQMLAQRYILAQRKNELKSVAPSDDEIRAFYELNRTSFVWSDMLKMFLVVVPKGTNAEEASAKASDIYTKLKDKKLSTNQITVDSRKENSGYKAGEMLINKSQLSGQQLGISYSDLLELFKNEKGYISQIIETETNYQFFTVIKKFDAKMLDISDVVRPETTDTVYDYIKEQLTKNKQMEYLTQAASEIAESLDTEANVDRKKKGADLDKLLNW